MAKQLAKMMAKRLAKILAKMMAKTMAKIPNRVCVQHWDIGGVRGYQLPIRYGGQSTLQQYPPLKFSRPDEHG